MSFERTRILKKRNKGSQIIKNLATYNISKNNRYSVSTSPNFE